MEVAPLINGASHDGRSATETVVPGRHSVWKKDDTKCYKHNDIKQTDKEGEKERERTRELFSRSERIK